MFQIEIYSLIIIFLHLQGLIWKIRAVSDIGKKSAPKFHSPPPLAHSIAFLGVLHQNKTLHNFHKRGSVRLLDA